MKPFSVTRLENIAKPSQLHDLPAKKAASIPVFSMLPCSGGGENRYSVARIVEPTLLSMRARQIRGCKLAMRCHDPRVRGDLAERTPWGKLAPVDARAGAPVLRVEADQY